MFKNNDLISSGQMAHILILTLIGVGILNLPGDLTEGIGTDGLWALLIGGIFTIGAAALIGYIIKKFPGKSYFEILTTSFTKPIAWIIAFLFILYALMINAFLIRVFGEVVKMFLLIRTPIEIIIFSVLLISAYLSRNGIEALGRLAELLFPIIMIPALILFLLGLIESDLTNLLPTFQATPMELVEVLPTAFFSFAGFEFILVFGTYLKRPDKAPKLMATGVGMVLAIYVIIFITILSIFGTEQLAHLVWPTMSVFKTIDFPGLFIQNVEGLVMVIWVFIVFMSIGPIHLVKTILIGDLLNLKERDFMALPLVPILYIVALIPENIAQTYAFMGSFSKYAIPIFALGVPILILISLGIRKGIGKERGSRA
ncbi:endospore germination permease [Serpentinicella sp. ANB-PHB4]|uniref:GerAB/ArcD/ProY family transporter n=1 Tax=Serpentinicella sp. ANB-PHB4 TaxID=3074076 RepID=UPI00285ECFB2|nr:endospore germination permease [Serpentinicella sp. ANB-PHB4]MDR5659132.1 endospore germination permease [Serpentinicella sp. ANB-PHB4]